MKGMGFVGEIPEDYGNICNPIPKNKNKTKTFIYYKAERQHLCQALCPEDVKSEGDPMTKVPRCFSP